MNTATQKIDFRVTEGDKNLIVRAAKAMGKTVSQFLLELSIRESKHILAENTQIVLSPAEWEEFCYHLDHPRRDLSRLNTLMNSPSVFEDA